MTSHLDLETLHLDSGGHESPDDGMCVMEAVAFFAHEPFSDAPQCASHAITNFLQSWNDALADDDRQRLKRFIPLVVGTRTTGEDERTRTWLATDWLVRTFAPAWLDKAGLAEAAGRLRAIEELTSDKMVTAALPIIEAAKQEASAAWSAAKSAARSAAESAARSAAESAAWSAAESAAWSAARSAAWSAADEALAPTVKELQASAEDLLERMIAVGKTEAVAA